MVYGISIYTNQLIWNSAVLYSKDFMELRRITQNKVNSYKIPYSAEFQKGTSENTLTLRDFSFPIGMWKKLY
jgi:hypothetical protein